MRFRKFKDSRVYAYIGKATFKLEWSFRFELGFRIILGDDDGFGVGLHVALLFIKLYFQVEHPGLIAISPKVPYGLPHPTVDWITAERHIYLEMYTGMRDLIITGSLWKDDMRSSSSDPWYAKGFYWPILSILKGRSTYKKEDLSPTETWPLPLPEGVTTVKATFQRSTWNFSRWFTKTETSCQFDFSPDGLHGPSRKYGEGNNNTTMFWVTCKPGDVAGALGQAVARVLEHRKRETGNALWLPSKASRPRGDTLFYEDAKSCA